LALRCTTASITRWFTASLSTMKSIGRGGLGAPLIGHRIR
jgi:hypothetical protein